MTAACINCGASLVPLLDDIQDWEYGVAWRSRLVECSACGLVTHDPPIQKSQIEQLYPSSYLAHSSASRSKSIYGSLKAFLGRLGARGVSRQIPAGGSLLEVGCGNGSFLRVLTDARPDIQVAGVDIMDVGVSGVSSFAFYRGQLEDVDFGERRFDVVYCSNLIEHVPDPLRFLRKVAGLLKPGGVIYGVTPDHLSIDRYLLRKYWAGYHYPRHTFVFNHENIRQILEKCGYQTPRVRGAYGFWYLSLANRFLELPGTKRRGLLFALVTAAFLPFDLAVNRFRCHGSMTFVARRSADVARSSERSTS
jgi:2-polyprenyl-3-methyl-5-hydroxy-6-metoxy-1,4-benzoquinol methylase